MPRSDGVDPDRYSRTDADRDIEEVVEDFHSPMISVRVKIGLIAMGLVGLGLASSYLPNGMNQVPIRPLHIWLGLLTAFLLLLIPGPVRSSPGGTKLLTTLFSFLCASFLVLALVDTAWPDTILPNGSLSRDAVNSGLAWDRVLKSGGNEMQVWLNPLPEGDFIVSSVAYHRDRPPRLRVRRIDSRGQILWEKLPEIECTSISEIVGHENGELLVIGSIHSEDGEKRSSYIGLIQAGKEGGLAWQRSYSGDRDWVIRTGIRVDDAGYILVGSSIDPEETSREYEISTGSGTVTYGYSGNERDVLLLRVDGNGDLIWERTWDYLWDDRVSHIQPSRNGYLLLMEGRPQEIHTAEIDDSGEILWQKDIALGYDLGIFSTGMSNDGGLIIGYHHESELPGNSISLLKIDGKGDLAWARRFPIGERYLRPTCVLESDDGDITVFSQEYESGAHETRLIHMLNTDIESNVTREKNLETSLTLGDTEPIASADSEYLLAGTQITWKVDLPFRYDWYNFDARLMKIRFDWENEDEFVPAKETDPVWDRFPTHGEEPTERDLERGYRFVSQHLTCTVYYTADFARINQGVTLEILNRSVDRIEITVPYGDDEIWRTEEITPSATLGYSRSAQLEEEVTQNSDETNISILLLPEMVDKGKAIIHFLYRVFDLPGEEGIYGFDEVNREGNERWKEGVLVDFSPGRFDKGTWTLNVTIVPNSDRVEPTFWEPEGAIPTTHEGIGSQGLLWRYTGRIPEEPAFRALFRYPP